MFEATAGNANVITVAKHGTTGFTGFGANFSVGLLAGETLKIDLGTSSQDITASIKQLLFTGTGSQTMKMIVIIIVQDHQ